MAFNNSTRVISYSHRYYATWEDILFCFEIFAISYVLISQLIFVTTIMRDRRLRVKPTNILLTNLGLSNITMAILNVLLLPTIRTYRWHYGSTSCRVITWVVCMVYYCAIYCLLAVNINHLILLIWPMRYDKIMNKVKVVALVCFPWVASGLFGLPILHTYGVGEARRNGTHCYMGATENHDKFRILSRIFGNFVPWSFQLLLNCVMIGYGVYRLRDMSLQPEVRKSIWRCSLALALANSIYYTFALPFRIFPMAGHVTIETYYALFLLYLSHVLFYPYVWLIHDDIRKAYSKLCCTILPKLCLKGNFPDNNNQESHSAESVDIPIENVVSQE